jgi:hypothetical protein
LTVAEAARAIGLRPRHAVEALPPAVGRVVAVEEAVDVVVEPITALELRLGLVGEVASTMTKYVCPGTTGRLRFSVAFVPPALTHATSLEGSWQAVRTEMLPSKFEGENCTLRFAVPTAVTANTCSRPEAPEHEAARLSGRPASSLNTYAGSTVALVTAHESVHEAAVVQSGSSQSRSRSKSLSIPSLQVSLGTHPERTTLQNWLQTRVPEFSP